MQAKRLHTLVKDPIVHVRVWWTMETKTKNPAYTERCQSLHNVEGGHSTVISGRRRRRRSHAFLRWTEFPLKVQWGDGGEGGGSGCRRKYMYRFA